MAVYKRGSRGEMVVKIQQLLHQYPDGIFGPHTEEAVKEFQRNNRLKPDGIVGVATLTKMKLIDVCQKTGLLKKSKRRIDLIIVHCSDTPEGRHNTVEDIRAWHKAKGWADIGYHFVVYIDGSIHNGRDVDKVGAHCSGHNSNSIGICYVGGCEGEVKNGKIVPKTDKNGYHIPKDTRTWEQKESLKYILKELKKMYPNAKIYGHHDFDKGKPCPCFDAKKEYQDI